MGFEFITCKQNTNDPLWLRNGSECAERLMPLQLQGAKCVPSKAAIHSALRDCDSVYLLDLEFHPIYLKDYGLDLAMYLISHGVPRDRIIIFSAYADRALSRFMDDLGRDAQGELPVFHTYEKESLASGSQALGERLAWRILQMRDWHTEGAGNDPSDMCLPEWVVGRSQALRDAVDLCHLVASGSEEAVLITGESGTGKEVIAKTIYEFSSRNSKPFIKLNCSALPETLVESELFGHKKGAFTSAWIDKKGAFELANHGVLFLDEIGDLSLTAQPKLLRAIQEGEIWPLGASHPTAVDVHNSEEGTEDDSSLLGCLGDWCECYSSADSTGEEAQP